jgi:hypothetical protein|tara:strand:+ start:1923 stop:2210 length:288 start_codon:yes stop_codon:yes gene_type:complete
MGLKVNSSVFEKRMKKLSVLPKFLLQDALRLTKENTPVASGNARNKTTIKGNKVVSDYAYAGRLDDGHSKQAPQGFTKPTIEQLDDDATKFVRKI